MFLIPPPPIKKHLLLYIWQHLPLDSSSSNTHTYILNVELINSSISWRQCSPPLQPHSPRTHTFLHWLPHELFISRMPNAVTLVFHKHRICERSRFRSSVRWTLSISFGCSDSARRPCFVRAAATATFMVVAAAVPAFIRRGRVAVRVKDRHALSPCTVERMALLPPVIIQWQDGSPAWTCSVPAEAVRSG